MSAVKRAFAQIFRYRAPLATRAFGVGPPYFASRSFSTDPALTPIRTGIRFARAARKTSIVFLSPPTFPGLIRRQSAPASAQAIASRWSKWMSAMTGIGEPARIFANAAAAFASGTATRAISHPSRASDRICATVARTSRVSVFVMLWTVTGAPPPTGTPPTRMRRVFLLVSMTDPTIARGGSRVDSHFRSPRGRAPR